MSNTLYLILGIGIAAAVTLLLRALPFLVFQNSGKTPAVVSYLGKVLPYAVMAMLVVYCLRDTQVTELSNWVPKLAASALVVGTYVWKRNTLFSIVLGTVCYMLLVQNWP